MQLNIPINPSTLIDLAKSTSGMQLKDMAQELGYDKTRVTKLKSGGCALTPTEIKYYSEKAGLNFMETLAELEIWRNPEAERFWRKR